MLAAKAIPVFPCLVGNFGKLNREQISRKWLVQRLWQQHQSPFSRSTFLFGKLTWHLETRLLSDYHACARHVAEYVSISPLLFEKALGEPIVY